MGSGPGVGRDEGELMGPVVWGLLERGTLMFVVRMVPRGRVEFLNPRGAGCCPRSPRSLCPVPAAFSHLTTPRLASPQRNGQTLLHPTPARPAAVRARQGGCSCSGGRRRPPGLPLSPARVQLAGGGAWEGERQGNPTFTNLGNPTFANMSLLWSMLAIGYSLG